MPLTLQLYKAHTHSLLQAHIMIAGGAALLFAKMEWLMCDCCLSPAEAVCSSLRCCQRWYAFFSWTHKFRTQSALIIVLLYRLPSARVKALTTNRYILCCASITHVDLWGPVNGFIRLRSCTNSLAHDCMPHHIQKPALICCCISPHTGTLQTDGCISRGQMMAVFSLYQAPTACSDCMMQLASF